VALALLLLNQGLRQWQLGLGAGIQP
jgi:hypothetical protein